jgi:antitoxin ParD1/3/4
MSKAQKRTFSLTEENAAYIDGKVASGAYLSASEVVREGLRAIQERDAAIERWLHEEVVPTIRRYEADPSRARPADEVFDELLDELDGQSRGQRRA